MKQLISNGEFRQYWTKFALVTGDVGAYEVVQPLTEEVSGTLKVTAKKPTGAEQFVTSVVTQAKSASVVLKNSMYDAVGETELYVEFYDTAGHKVTEKILCVDVIVGTGEGTASVDEMTELESVISQGLSAAGYATEQGNAAASAAEAAEAAAEEAEAVVNEGKDAWDSKTGKDVSGLSQSPEQGTTVAGGTGAEIYNDYRTRTFGTDGAASAGNVATGEYAHAEGSATTAQGKYSHAEGQKTEASGANAHAEGNNTEASGSSSHAEGAGSMAKGTGCHAEGNNTEATSLYSHAEGRITKASSMGAHAEGYQTEASGRYSHAEGSTTHAAGNNSHAGGEGTIANTLQTAIGCYNVESAGPTSSGDKTGDLLIVGNGSSTTKSNAMRVAANGTVYGCAAFVSSGADYAEYFEWQDGNPEAEDRTGLFVALDGEKIRLAGAEDEYILGVVSAFPLLKGDAANEAWQGMYVTDVFGRKLLETVEVEETVIETEDIVDEETGLPIPGRTEVIPAHTETRWVLNPEYDPEQAYVPRENRPEWAAIGLVGKLVVVDDGTCEAGGYCAPETGGVATKSYTPTRFKVMARLDDTHVKILMR